MEIHLHISEFAFYQQQKSCIYIAMKYIGNIVKLVKIDDLLGCWHDHFSTSELGGFSGWWGF